MARNKKIKNNDNQVNQQKNNDIFVNLPFLLLSKIIRELNDDLDRVCFSLVCKRWFDQRDKYLWFNCRDLPQNNDLIDEKKNKEFTMNSYREQYKRSLDLKSDCTLNIRFYTNDPSIIIVYGVHTSNLYNDSILQGNADIPPSFSRIKFANSIELGDRLIAKLAKSNLSSIHFCSNVLYTDSKIRLPSNIKEIITKCYISESWLLPLELERYSVSIPSNTRVVVTVETSELPRTLRVFKTSVLSHFNAVDIGSFPPNLEELHLFAEKDQPSDDTTQLPSTLKHLSISTSWLKNIRDLKSIETLKLIYRNGVSLRQDDIPSYITHLTLCNHGMEKSITKELIPKNIKYLKLEYKICFKSDVFSTFEQLETLDLTELAIDNESLEIGELPDSLINLYLPKQFNQPIKRCMALPVNLQHLSLGEVFSGKVVGLPTSLKSISICGTSMLTPTSFPKSIESINIGNYSKVIEPNQWPPSLRSLTLASSFMEVNDLNFFPLSVTSLTISDSDKHFRRLSDKSFLRTLSPKICKPKRCFNLKTPSQIDVFNDTKKNTLCFHRTHFRYGTITWTTSPSDPTLFEFSLKVAFRNSYFIENHFTQYAVNDTINHHDVKIYSSFYTFSDCKYCDIKTIRTAFVVNHVDKVNDWLTTEMKFQYRFTQTTGTAYINYYEAGRLDTLINNANKYWNVATELNFPGCIGGSSPASGVLPVLNAYNGIEKLWQVPVADMTPGATFKFAMSNETEMPGTQPTGLKVSESGLVSYTATQTGMWSAQIKVQKYVQNAYVTYIIIDFLINVTKAPVVIPNPPVFVDPTPARSTYVNFTSTIANSVTIVGMSPQTTSSVLISIGNVPQGMTVSPQTNGPANYGTIKLTWSPTTTQIGAYVISLGLVDSQGITLTYSVHSFYIRVLVSPCGNGALNQTTGLCNCLPGWGGKNCTECDTGFYGPLCLPNPPCANGTVNSGINGDGQCICDPGWYGIQCSISLTQRCDPKKPNFIVDQISNSDMIINPTTAQIYLNKDVTTPLSIKSTIETPAALDLYFIVDVSSERLFYYEFQEYYASFENSLNIENVNFGLGYFSDTKNQPNTFQIQKLLSKSIVDDVEALTFKNGAPQPNYQYQALTLAASTVQWSANGAIRMMILYTDNNLAPTDNTLITTLQNELAKQNILLGVICYSDKTNSYSWLTPQIGGLISLNGLNSDYWYQLAIDDLIQPMISSPQILVSGDTSFISSGPTLSASKQEFETKYVYVQPANINSKPSITTRVVGFGKQTVQIHINHAPTTSPTSITLFENSNAIFNIPANDIDGNILNIQFSSIPSLGVLKFNDTQTVVLGQSYQLPSVQANLFKYIPNPFKYGTDQVKYTIDDGCLSAASQVDFTIKNVNYAPVCDAVGVTTDQNTPAPFTIKSSDADPEDVVTISFQGLANILSLGSISIASVPIAEGTQYPSNSNFVFTPISTATASTVKVLVFISDTKLNAQCTLSITVNRVAVTPTLNINPAQIMAPDSKLTIQFTVSDPDPNETLKVTLSAITKTRGTLYDTKNIPISGTTYTLGTYPLTTSSIVSSSISYQATNEVYSDTSFVITVTDSTGLSSSSTVTIDVSGSISQYPPFAKPVGPFIIAQNNQTNSFTLDGVHTNQPGYQGGFKVFFLNNPQHGLILTANGNSLPSTIQAPFSAIYKPYSTFFGTEQFSYYVTDDSGLSSDPVTVTITVTKVDYAPVITIIPSIINIQNVCPNTPQPIDISISITNINPMTNLRVNLLNSPAIGSLLSDGKPITAPALLDTTKPLQYLPSINNYDSFETYFKVEACEVLCSSAFSNISSESVPSKPTGEGKSLVTVQNQQVSFALVGNDCQDSTKIQYQFSSLPMHGELLDSNGAPITSTDQLFSSNSFTYAPNKDVSDLNSIGGKGPLESFSYLVINKHSISSITYPIQITVNPIPMFVGERNLTTLENVKLTIPIKATAPEGNRYTMNITSFTGRGQLYYFQNGVDLVNISSNGLVFTESNYVLYYMPPKDTYGVNIDSFQFAIKQRYSSEIYTIYIDVTHVFIAPKVVPLTYMINGTSHPIVNDNVDLYVNTSTIITFNVTSDDHPWTELKSTFGSGLMTGGAAYQFDELSNAVGEILRFNSEIKRSATDNLWRVVYVPNKGRSGLRLSQFTLIGTDPLNMTDSQRLFMSVLRVNVPPVVNANQLQYNTSLTIPVLFNNISVFDPDSTDKNNITFTLSLISTTTNELTLDGLINLPFASSDSCNTTSNQVRCLDRNDALNRFLNTITISFNKTGTYQLIVYVNDLGYNAINRVNNDLSDTKNITILVGASPTGSNKNNTVVISAAIAAAVVAAAIISLGVWRLMKTRAPPTDAFFGDSPFSEGTVSSNPLYQESANTGVNPLYEGADV
ncbi:substrate adhesion molecule [Heterostelium album PN500]|uniref:Substrate adhesion molecule n=1 Tax=Heterostelium pallidum (strain ATCC 26659 / Pp 5 / PN500) TaxID=670386 RepID=D3BTJ7_HETP5|nr:substrate adhesion molecule [Heterostelium album PN500]EFA75414.1 substrate adhesion molecule [Heterostelium album PN500]|eukprot:XP_020427548.1 substrate adhesion molecule [Heterostelium album PN500]